MAAHIAGVYVVYMSRLFFALSHLMITLSLFPPLEFQQWYDHRVEAPHTDTQGATGLQEASDETSVDEVMEMRGLHPLSSSDDDPLHSRSSVHDC